MPRETVPLAERLASIRRLAQMGVNKAQMRRKYTTKGNFTPVEMTLFLSLIGIEKQLQHLEDEQRHRFEEWV